MELLVDLNNPSTPVRTGRPAVPLSRLSRLAFDERTGRPVVAWTWLWFMAFDPCSYRETETGGKQRPPNCLRPLFAQGDLYFLTY